MYEASFGLKRRPFAATPDASCFLSAGPIQAALDELVICVEQGQGIGVLTAPAGTGKTLLCERLRGELDDRFETIFLRHASFLTRRALLQTVLCELNHQFHHPSEQELRLELFPAIRALKPKREALVLICDEAHQLTESLLEELRILADFAEDGRPLVRLVLVGQLSLEEKLTQPSLEAFNQRIRAHINLATFDLAESKDYVDYRITWAGGRTDEVFTPGALNVIARASDGVPRCINQLADHALLLAFVAEQRPVQEETVREALCDLRRLPLHWNEAPQSITNIEQDELSLDDTQINLSNRIATASLDSPGYSAKANPAAAMYSFEPVTEVGDDSDIIELPAFARSIQSFKEPIPDTTADVAELESDSTAFNARTLEVGGDDWRQTVELFNPRNSDASSSSGLEESMPNTTLPTDAQATDSRSNRRLDLHELIHDAYHSSNCLVTEAIESIPSKSEPSAANSCVVGFNSVTKNEIRNVNETFGNNASIHSATASFAAITKDGFCEEMIVDRYTSIDAGFEPPAITLPNTRQSVSVQREQASSPPAIAKLTSLPVASHTIQSPDLEASIESVLKDVYSISESLSPANPPNSSNESAFDALNQDAESSSEEATFDSLSIPVNAEFDGSWESIETPLPPPVEARPFRYLFSRLRRKQQGLS